MMPLDDCCKMEKEKIAKIKDLRKNFRFIHSLVNFDFTHPHPRP